MLVIMRYYNHSLMKGIENQQFSKRKYSRISFKKREKLIKQVQINQNPLSIVAKKLKIKQSTARMILRKYKASGQFRTKNFKNKRNTDLRHWNTSKTAQFKKEITSTNNQGLNSPTEIHQNRQQIHINQQQTPILWVYYNPPYTFYFYPQCQSI